MKPGGLCSPSDGSSSPSQDDIGGVSAACNPHSDGSQFPDASTSEDSPACLTPDLIEDRYQGAKSNSNIANGYICNDVTNGLCETLYDTNKDIDVPRHVLSPPCSEDGDDGASRSRTILAGAVASKCSDQSTLYQGRCKTPEFLKGRSPAPSSKAKSLPPHMYGNSVDNLSAGSSEHSSTSVYNESVGCKTTTNRNSSKVISCSESQSTSHNIKTPKYRRKCSLEEMVAKLHSRSEPNIQPGSGSLQAFLPLRTPTESKQEKVSSCFIKTQDEDKPSSSSQQGQRELVSCDNPNTATCDARLLTDSSVKDVRSQCDSGKTSKACDKSSVYNENSAKEPCRIPLGSDGSSTGKGDQDPRCSMLSENNMSHESDSSKMHLGVSSNLEDSHSPRCTLNSVPVDTRTSLGDRTSGDSCVSDETVLNISKDAQNDVLVDGSRTSEENITGKDAKLELEQGSGRSDKSDCTSINTKADESVGKAEIRESEKINSVTSCKISVENEVINLVDDDTGDSGSDVEILFEKGMKHRLNRVTSLCPEEVGEKNIDNAESVDTSSCNSGRHGGSQYLEPISDEENSLICAPSPPSELSSASGIPSNSDTPLFSDTPSDASRGAIMVKISDAVAAILSDVSEDSLPPSPGDLSSKNSFSNILPKLLEMNDKCSSSPVSKNCTGASVTDNIVVERSSSSSQDVHEGKKNVDSSAAEVTDASVIPGNDGCGAQSDDKKCDSGEILLTQNDSCEGRTVIPLENVEDDPPSSSVTKVDSNYIEHKETTSVNRSVNVSASQEQKASVGLPSPSTRKSFESTDIDSEVPSLGKNSGSSGQSGPSQLVKSLVHRLPCRSCSMHSTALLSNDPCNTNSLCQKPTSGTPCLSSQPNTCSRLRSECGESVSGLDGDTVSLSNCTCDKSVVGFDSEVYPKEESIITVKNSDSLPEKGSGSVGDSKKTESNEICQESTSSISIPFAYEDSSPSQVDASTQPSSKGLGSFPSDTQTKPFSIPKDEITTASLSESEKATELSRSAATCDVVGTLEYPNTYLENQESSRSSLPKSTSESSAEEAQSAYKKISGDDVCDNNGEISTTSKSVDKYITTTSSLECTAGSTSPASTNIAIHSDVMSSNVAFYEGQSNILHSDVDGKSSALAEVISREKKLPVVVQSSLSKRSSPEVSDDDVKLISDALVSSVESLSSTHAHENQTLTSIVSSNINDDSFPNESQSLSVKFENGEQNNSNIVNLSVGTSTVAVVPSEMAKVPIHYTIPDSSEKENISNSSDIKSETRADQAQLSISKESLHDSCADSKYLGNYSSSSTNIQSPLNTVNEGRKTPLKSFKDRGQRSPTTTPVRKLDRSRVNVKKFDTEIVKKDSTLTSSLSNLKDDVLSAGKRLILSSEVEKSEALLTVESIKKNDFGNESSGSNENGRLDEGHSKGDKSVSGIQTPQKFKEEAFSYVQTTNVLKDVSPTVTWEKETENLDTTLDSSKAFSNESIPSMLSKNDHSSEDKQLADSVPDKQLTDSVDSSKNSVPVRNTTLEGGKLVSCIVPQNSESKLLQASCTPGTTTEMNRNCILYEISKRIEVESVHEIILDPDDSDVQLKPQLIDTVCSERPKTENEFVIEANCEMNYEASTALLVETKEKKDDALKTKTSSPILSERVEENNAVSTTDNLAKSQTEAEHEVNAVEAGFLGKNSDITVPKGVLENEALSEDSSAEQELGFIDKDVHEETSGISESVVPVATKVLEEFSVDKVPEYMMVESDIPRIPITSEQGPAANTYDDFDMTKKEHNRNENNVKSILTEIPDKLVEDKVHGKTDLEGNLVAATSGEPKTGTHENVGNEECKTIAEQTDADKFQRPFNPFKSSSNEMLATVFSENDSVTESPELGLSDVVKEVDLNQSQTTANTSQSVSSDGGKAPIKSLFDEAHLTSASDVTVEERFVGEVVTSCGSEINAEKEVTKERNTLFEKDSFENDDTEVMLDVCQTETSTHKLIDCHQAQLPFDTEIANVMNTNVPEVMSNNDETKEVKLDEVSETSAIVTSLPGGDAVISPSFSYPCKSIEGESNITDNVPVSEPYSSVDPAMKEASVEMESLTCDSAICSDSSETPQGTPVILATDKVTEVLSSSDSRGENLHESSERAMSIVTETSQKIDETPVLEPVEDSYEIHETQESGVAAQPQESVSSVTACESEEIQDLATSRKETDRSLQYESENFSRINEKQMLVPSETSNHCDSILESASTGKQEEVTENVEFMPLEIPESSVSNCLESSKIGHEVVSATGKFESDDVMPFEIPESSVTNCLESSKIGHEVVSATGKFESDDVIEPPQSKISLTNENTRELVVTKQLQGNAEGIENHKFNVSKTLITSEANHKTNETGDHQSTGGHLFESEGNAKLLGQPFEANQGMELAAKLCEKDKSDESSVSKEFPRSRETLECTTSGERLEVTEVDDITKNGSLIETKEAVESVAERQMESCIKESFAIGHSLEISEANLNPPEAPFSAEAASTEKNHEMQSSCKETEKRTLPIMAENALNILEVGLLLNEETPVTIEKPLEVEDVTESGTETNELIESDSGDMITDCEAYQSARTLSSDVLSEPEKLLSSREVGESANILLDNECYSIKIVSIDESCESTKIPQSEEAQKSAEMLSLNDNMFMLPLSAHVPPIAESTKSAETLPGDVVPESLHVLSSVVESESGNELPRDKACELAETHSSDEPVEPFKKLDSDDSAETTKIIPRGEAIESVRTADDLTRDQISLGTDMERPCSYAPLNIVEGKSLMKESEETESSGSPVMHSFSAPISSPCENISGETIPSEHSEAKEIVAETDFQSNLSYAVSDITEGSSHSCVNVDDKFVNETVDIKVGEISESEGTSVSTSTSLEAKKPAEYLFSSDISKENIPMKSVSDATQVVSEPGVICNKDCTPLDFDGHHSDYVGEEDPPLQTESKGYHLENLSLPEKSRSVEKCEDDLLGDKGEQSLSAEIGSSIIESGNVTMNDCINEKCEGILQENNQLLMRESCVDGHVVTGMDLIPYKSPSGFIDNVISNCSVSFDKSSSDSSASDYSNTAEDTSINNDEKKTFAHNRKEHESCESVTSAVKADSCESTTENHQRIKSSAEDHSRVLLDDRTGPIDESLSHCDARNILQCSSHEEGQPCRDADEVTAVKETKSYFANLDNVANDLEKEKAVQCLEDMSHGSLPQSENESLVASEKENHHEKYVSVGKTVESAEVDLTSSTPNLANAEEPPSFMACEDAENVLSFSYTQTSSMVSSGISEQFTSSSTEYASNVNFQSQNMVDDASLGRISDGARSVSPTSHQKDTSPQPSSECLEMKSVFSEECAPAEQAPIVEDTTKTTLAIDSVSGHPTFTLSECGEYSSVNPSLESVVTSEGNQKYCPENTDINKLSYFGIVESSCLEKANASVPTRIVDSENSEAASSTVVEESSITEPLKSSDEVLCSQPPLSEEIKTVTEPAGEGANMRYCSASEITPEVGLEESVTDLKIADKLSSQEVDGTEKGSTEKESLITDSPQSLKAPTEVSSSPGKSGLASSKDISGDDDDSSLLKVVEVKKEVCFSGEDSLSLDDSRGDYMKEMDESMSCCKYDVEGGVITILDDKLEDTVEPPILESLCPLCREVLAEPLEEHIIKHHICVSFIPAKTTTSYRHHMVPRVSEDLVMLPDDSENYAYVCRSCHFASKDINAVRFHLNIHEDIYQVRTGTSSCSCNQKVYSYQFHKWKSLIHNSLYFCGTCSYYFACERGLMNHVAALHYTQNRCKICNEEVSDNEVVVHLDFHNPYSKVDEGDDDQSELQMTTRSRGCYGVSWNIYDNSLNYLDGKHFRLNVASKVTDENLDRSYLTLPIRNVLDEVTVPDKFKLDPAKDIRKYLQGKKDIRASEGEINELLKNFNLFVQMHLEKKSGSGSKKGKCSSNQNKVKKENELLEVLGIRTVKLSPKKASGSPDSSKSSKRKNPENKPEPPPEENITDPSTLTRTRSGMQPSKEEESGSLVCNFMSGLGLERNVEVHGEWSREHTYVCCSCGAGYLDLADIMDHKWECHPSVWCAHTMFQGQESLPQSFCLQFQPPTDRPTKLPVATPLTPVVQSESLQITPDPKTEIAADDAKEKKPMKCTRCGIDFAEVEVFHSHLVECGGLHHIIIAKKKNKKGFRFKRRKGQGVPSNRYDASSLPSTPLKSKFGDRSSGLSTPSLDKSHSSLIQSSGVKRRLELAIGSINNNELKSRLKAIISGGKGSSSSVLGIPGRRTIKMKLRKKVLDSRLVRKTRHSDKVKEEPGKPQKGDDTSKGPKSDEKQGSAKDEKVDGDVLSGKKTVQKKGNVEVGKDRRHLDVGDKISHPEGNKNKVKKSGGGGSKLTDGKKSKNVSEALNESTNETVETQGGVNVMKKKSKSGKKLVEKKINGLIDVCKQKMTSKIEQLDPSGSDFKTIDVKKALAKKILSKKSKTVSHEMSDSISDKTVNIVESNSLIGNKEISVQKRSKQSEKQKPSKSTPLKSKEGEKSVSALSDKVKSKKSKGIQELQTKKNFVKPKSSTGKLGKSSDLNADKNSAKPLTTPATPKALSTTTPKVAKKTKPIMSNVGGKKVGPQDLLPVEVSNQLPPKKKVKETQVKSKPSGAASNKTKSSVKAVSSAVSSPVKKSKYISSSSSEDVDDEDSDSEPEVIRNFRSGRGCTGRMGLRNKSRPRMSRYSFRTCLEPTKKEVKVEVKAEEVTDEPVVKSRVSDIDRTLSSDKDELSDSIPLSKRRKRKIANYENQDDCAYVPNEITSDSEDEEEDIGLSSAVRRRMVMRKRKKSQSAIEMPELEEMKEEEPSNSSMKLEGESANIIDPGFPLEINTKLPKKKNQGKAPKRPKFPVKTTKKKCQAKKSSTGKKSHVGHEKLLQTDLAGVDTSQPNVTDPTELISREVPKQPKKSNKKPQKSMNSSVNQGIVEGTAQGQITNKKGKKTSNSSVTVPEEAGDATTSRKSKSSRASSSVSVESGKLIPKSKKKTPKRKCNSTTVRDDLDKKMVNQLSVKPDDLLVETKVTGGPQKIKERSSSISLGSLSRVGTVEKKPSKTIKKCSSLSNIPQNVTESKESITLEGKLKKKGVLSRPRTLSEMSAKSEEETMPMHPTSVVEPVRKPTKTKTSKKTPVQKKTKVKKNKVSAHGKYKSNLTPSQNLSECDVLGGEIPLSELVQSSGVLHDTEVTQTKVLKGKGKKVNKEVKKKPVRLAKKVKVIPLGENIVSHSIRRARLSKLNSIISGGDTCLKTLELQVTSVDQPVQPADVIAEKVQLKKHILSKKSKYLKKKKKNDVGIAVDISDSDGTLFSPESSVQSESFSSSDELSGVMKNSRKRRIPMKTVVVSSESSASDKDIPSGVFIPTKKSKKLTLEDPTGVGVFIPTKKSRTKSKVTQGKTKSKSPSTLPKITKEKKGKKDTVLNNHVASKKPPKGKLQSDVQEIFVKNTRIAVDNGENYQVFEAMPILEPMNIASLSETDLVSNDNSGDDSAGGGVSVRVKRRRSSVEKIKDIPTRSTVGSQENPSPPLLHAFIDEQGKVDQKLSAVSEESFIPSTSPKSSKTPALRKRRTQSSHEIGTKEPSTSQILSTNSSVEKNSKKKDSSNSSVLKKPTKRKRAASVTGVPKSDTKPEEMTLVKENDDSAVVGKVKKIAQKKKKPHSVKKVTDDPMCLDCGLRFDSIASLEDHRQDCITIALEMSLMEAEDNLFECQHCHLTFARKSTQRQHTASCRLGKYKKTVQKHDNKSRRRTLGRETNAQAASIPPAYSEEAAVLSHEIPIKNHDEDVNEKVDVDLNCEPDIYYGSQDEPESLGSVDCLRISKDRDYVDSIAGGSKFESFEEFSPAKFKGSPKLRRRSRTNGKIDHANIEDTMNTSIASEDKCVVCGCEIRDEDMSNKHLLLEQFAHSCQQQPVLEVCVLLAYYNLSIEAVRSLAASAIFYQGSTILKLDAKQQTSPDLDPCLSNNENKSASQLLQILATPHCMWVSSVLEAIAKHYYSVEAVSISGTRQEALKAITVLEELFNEIANIDSTIRKNQMLRTMKENFEAGTL